MHQFRRRHQAIAIGMMLVHADGIEAQSAASMKSLYFRWARFGIEQRQICVHPHGLIGVPEIGWQFRIRHQMEPYQLHRHAPCPMATGQY